MKQKLLCLLGICVVICLLAGFAAAQSWVCPQCGAENDGNYCPECGAKNPSPGEGITITDVVFTPQNNGDTLIQWEDSVSASWYTIKYTMEDWDGFFSDRARYDGKQAILGYLIPGVTYQFIISNGVTSATGTYTVPNPPFSEFPVTADRMTLSEDLFSLTAMKQDPLISFDIQVHYPTLTRSREYTAKLVLNTPFGYCNAVIRWDSFTLENRYRYVYTTCYMKTNWLDHVRETFGSVPIGEYTFEIYMDGELYGYTGFTVSP